MMEPDSLNLPRPEDRRILKMPLEKSLYDMNSNLKYLELLKSQRNKFSVPYSGTSDILLPPRAYVNKEANCASTRQIWAGINKARSPTFAGKWLRDGVHFVSGSSNGELTLWNPIRFLQELNFAHDSAVRAISVSYDNNWIITADHNGNVKYWQTNLNQVHSFLAHVDPIRDLCFSSTDSKFATCGDDGLIKVWDFEKSKCDCALQGHGTDVKCLDWHPLKGIILSGSKDCQQPIMLWDPRNCTSLCTIHSHKNSVMGVRWNRNGNLFASASKDKTVKIFDIRTMKELQTLRGHKKEVYTVSWHSIYENFLSSGGVDGSLIHWLVGQNKELASFDSAHDGVIWEISWHPEGHMFASVSNDQTTKLWVRNPPESVPPLPPPPDTNLQTRDPSNHVDEKIENTEFFNENNFSNANLFNKMNYPPRMHPFFSCITPTAVDNGEKNDQGVMIGKKYKPITPTKEEIDHEEDYFYNPEIPFEDFRSLEMEDLFEVSFNIPPVIFSKPRNSSNLAIKESDSYIERSFLPSNITPPEYEHIIQNQFMDIDDIPHGEV